MLLLTLIIFALTAMGGLFLISYVLTDKNTPKAVAIIHGSFGALGIVLLILCSFYFSSVWISLILFILVAIGGVYLFFRDILGSNPPKLLALAHGLGAVIAFLTLVYFVLRIYFG